MLEVLDKDDVKEVEIEEKKVVSKKLTIEDIPIETCEIAIIGDTPLISNAWSQEAIRMMKERGTTGQAAVGRKKRDAKKEYLGSLYLDEDKDPCFPGRLFKNCFVDAASFIPKVTKVQIRGALHPTNENYKIYGEHRQREDMVRLASGTADVRYRAEFPKWGALVSFTYNANVFDDKFISSLGQIAGFHIGIGAFRPPCKGPYGRFHIGTPDELKEIIDNG